MTNGAQWAIFGMLIAAMFASIATRTPYYM